MSIRMRNGDVLTLPLIRGEQPHQRTTLEAQPASVGPKWLAVALREKFFMDKYTFADLQQDILSGFVVGMVAIPLGMALGIATGVSPQLGLYTVIVAGFIAATLGGSRFQVSGPTAAFVVILEPIVVEYGIAGLLTAGLMSGFIVVGMGLAGMGKLIHYMPDTVKYGFTSGIAVSIGAQQIKDFLGVSIPSTATHFIDICIAIGRVIDTVSFQAVLVASCTMGIIIGFPKFMSAKIPAPLVAITSMTLLVYLIELLVPSLTIATIGSRFSYTLDGVQGHGIPPEPPVFALPWTWTGPGGGSFSLSWEIVYDLIPSAIRIAMLGSIESLLSAVIADGMAEQLSNPPPSTRHDPDCELIGIGIANIVAPFFGGIPATGAIARTATNIRFGARSPISAMIHSGFALTCVLFLAPAMSHVPMSALAALLLFVAYNMGEPDHFLKLLKTSPKDDKIVLLSCFGLTVVFDMVVGVFGGLVIAAVLFAKQMTTTVSLQRGNSDMAVLAEMSGKEILVYEMTGPLFFGTAKQVSNILEEAEADRFVQSVVLIMDSVPVLDVSGALALSAGVEKVLRSNKSVFLVGVRAQPLKLIRHYLPENRKSLYVMDSMQALHEVVTRIHDIPSTPNLRWISQRDGLTSVSPGLRFLSRANSGENTPGGGRQQIQASSSLVI
jgi:SulP family sulfate permease